MTTMFRERFAKVRAELLAIDTDLARVVAEREASSSIDTLGTCMDRLATCLDRVVKILVRVIDSLP
jgi:hypothetical protein